MRVQIPAYTDRWWMGDRYGDVIDVVKATRKMSAALHAQDPRRYTDPIMIALVKLDKSGKAMKFVLDDCTVV
jgi:hypothetical protein